MNKIRTMALLLSLAMVLLLAAPSALSDLHDEQSILSTLDALTPVRDTPIDPNLLLGSTQIADDLPQPDEPAAQDEPAPDDVPATDPPAESPDVAPPAAETPTAPAPDSAPSFDQIVIVPPVDLGIPKPQQEDFIPKDGAITYQVTFIYMNAEGMEQIYLVSVDEGMPAEAPIPPPSYMLGGKIFDFIGWDTSFNSITAATTVRARYREVTLFNPTIDEYFLYGYAGKPGKDVQLTFPIKLFKADDPLAFHYSNLLKEGIQLMLYDKNLPLNQFDQSLCQLLGIQMMQLLIDTKDISSLPFTTKSITAANGERLLPYIIQPFAADPAYYSQFGFGAQTGSINRGFACFDLVVRSDAENGTYSIPLTLTWIDGEGQHELNIAAQVEITGQKTNNNIGSGSSSGGGSIGTPAEPKPIPKPHLYIESVRTEPENPKAGDTFDVILTMVNTSEKLFLHNMIMNYSVNDDLLRPADNGTGYVYIKKMNANTTREERIRVESLPDIPSKLVKMSVSFEYEDQKFTQGSLQQDVTVPVLPIQRMKVDEPTMSSNNSVSVDQEFEVEVAVANEGKTTLYNLYAIVTSDNGDLLPGTSFHGGKLEPNESRKITVNPAGKERGEYNCNLVITYENDAGDISEPVKKPFTFVVIEDEEFDYESMYGPEDLTPPEPEKPMAMQIMQSLPLWLYAAVAGLFLLIIISMTVNARLRRKRAMEDDEMD